MQRTPILLIGLCSLALAGVLAVFWFAAPPLQSPAGSPDRVTVGQPALEQSALIYAAQDKGFFARNGLEVAIIDTYPSGVQPVEDLANGRLDLAVSAEYPVVSAVVRGKNLSVLCVIDRYQNEKLLGRKDRGIVAASDLKGKRIGYPNGTIVEFFLGRFLQLHGISAEEVTLVPVNPPDISDALAGGGVDAVAGFEPHVAAMEERFGDNVTVWQLQSSQPLYGVVSARSGWAADHPDRIRRFLRALADAETFAADHPAEFRTLVQKRLNLSETYTNEIWPDHRFSLSLDQSLLLAMEDQGRWIIRTQLSGTRPLPNFLDTIDTSGLRDVNGEAVSIIERSDSR